MTQKLRTEYLKEAVDRMISGLYESGNYARRDDMSSGPVYYGPGGQQVSAWFTVETTVPNEARVAMTVVVTLT